MSNAATDSELIKTALYGLHIEQKAKMVPFAGHSMPVQYPAGLMNEHLHTRKAAGLFDVSHMGQVKISGENRNAALESIMPVDVAGLGVDKQRYGMLLNSEGGIIDDLMFVNRGTHIFMIINGACKAGDIAYMNEKIGSESKYKCQIEVLEKSLIALQGPKAVDVLSKLISGVEKLIFMTGAAFTWQGYDLYITRSGYTGEDGFEISVPNDAVEKLARTILQNPDAMLIGLGARNSLRLEAGLCLYGNDIDQSTTPVQAQLNWAIQKVRRTEGERAGGFAGAEKILAQLDKKQALEKQRVCLKAKERVPVRDGVELIDAQDNKIGKVTSGLLSPTLGEPIAIGYVNPELSALGTQIYALVRGKKIPMEISKSPFVPTNYYRG